MKIKLLRSILLISIIISIFTSTGLSKGIKAKEVNILMPAPFADSTSEIIKRFNVENNGRVKIKVTRGPLETESVSDLAISSLLLGENQFDIMLIDVTWLPKYAAAGWLEPLDKWINSSQWDQLAEGAKLGNSYKNRIYRWPFVADMGLLYWRTDLMEKPPRNHQELIEISTNLVNNKKVKYGYVWQGRQYEGLSCVFLEVIKGFGGDWIDEEGKPNLNSKESEKAMSWLKELITKNASPKAVINFSETETLQAFESGDAALMRNWPYAWSELQKENSKVKGKIGVTTMVANKVDNTTATLGSWGFSILKDSKNKSLAYEAITYLTNTNSQKELFINNGYTPTNSTVFNDPELLEYSPILKTLKKALRSAKPRPETPLYAQISDVLQKQLSAILTNKLEVKSAINSAQSNTERIIDSAGDKF